jgi:hypothetical protein
VPAAASAAGAALCCGGPGVAGTTAGVCAGGPEGVAAFAGAAGVAETPVDVWVVGPRAPACADAACPGFETGCPEPLGTAPAAAAGVVVAWVWAGVVVAWDWPGGVVV